MEEKNIDRMSDTYCCKILTFDSGNKENNKDGNRKGRNMVQKRSKETKMIISYK